MCHSVIFRGVLLNIGGPQGYHTYRKLIHVTTLADKFSCLSLTNKALFLSRAVHEATICARAAAYKSIPAHPERSYDHPDPIALRDANEFIHRVAGYMSHVLKRSEGLGQDKSVMNMIEQVFRDWGISHRLEAWLPD